MGVVGPVAAVAVVVADADIPGAGVAVECAVEGGEEAAGVRVGVVGGGGVMALEAAGAEAG